MPKALIVTVGAQGEQIIFSLKKLKPKFLGLLATNTEQSKKTVNEVLEGYPLAATNFRVFYCEDDANEIGKIIQNFYEIYNWLTKVEKIPVSEILVDPTGGRKWMSAGVIMITSFLGLNMVYVDVEYNKKIPILCPNCNTPVKEITAPNPDTMGLSSLGNAYEQTGFLEEAKADRLFNEFNFSVAMSIYDFLSQKLRDPKRVEIKKLISNCYYHWSIFNFTEACNYIESAIKKIEQYEMLSEHLPKLKKQFEILKTLKENDNQEITYFDLLRRDDFVKNMLFTLVAQSERFAENKQYDQSIIILYRILEFIAQYRLAQNGINTRKITDEIRNKYNEQYKKITKEIFQAESEIPDRISLIQCWILLYCIGDELVSGEKEEFLKGLREKTELRNLLWWEHGNKIADENKYKNFRGYVLYHWLTKVFQQWEKEVKDHLFIKF